MEIAETLGKSDHNLIRFNISLNTTAKENTKIVQNFRAGDFEGFKGHLSSEVWEGITNCHRRGQVGPVNHTGLQVTGNGSAQE